MVVHQLFRRSSSQLRTMAVAGSSIAIGILAPHENPETPIAKRNNFGMLDKHNPVGTFSFPASISSLFEPNKTALDPHGEGVDQSSSLELPPIPLSESFHAAMEKQIRTKVYDFIILGHGNAGESAARTLRRRCPKARIAIVDPLRQPSWAGKENESSTVTYYPETATGFDPKTRTVSLLSDNYTQLQYKHGILLATGSRGAPPPLELFEESSLSRVLELRTTELQGNTKRPVMAPEKVRAAVIAAATKGGKITVLGSGWEALDLVCAAEKVGRKQPTIVFANPGPAWNLLPQYLSSELRKKLVKRNIDILDRSVVRYVAEIPQGKTKKLELHSAKVYDLLETKRTVMDLLILAPDSFGTKGTASLPTRQIPECMKETSDGRPWYKTWSQLTKSSPVEPSVVVCFEDDGRVAVNAELSVASRIFAAGSVAKYPNSSTGQASIAGEGVMNGAEAGRVVGINMSREYLERNATFSTRYGHDAESFSTSSLPVWRSDVTAYTGTSVPIPSSLSSIGVHALCVGNCDSERMATRGFWWTNSSAQRKITKLIEEEEAEEELVGKSEATSKRRLSRRRLSRQRRRLGKVTPIYGVGVVFYLDSNGRIRGIMTWGLPFADEERGSIKPPLLEAIQQSILTNAGISALDAEENHQMMNTAMAKDSQKFVTLAARGQFSESMARSHGLDGPIKGFSTPLYRYTEVGPASNTTLRVLKRKEGGALGVLGEDLFARDETALEEEQASRKENDNDAKVQLSNIPVTNYPVTVVPFQLEAAYGSKAASLESLAELNRYLAVQRGWEENENRARPGKEDPLWLRPGDERRNTSRKQMIIDAYRSIMFPHRS